MGGLALAFTTPWLLGALVVLPILWLILRAIPPAPIRRRFPGVALLLGLEDNDAVTDRTPWWLLLLRMIAVAAVIIGLAGPVLNPADPMEGDGPVLVVMDGGWASASSWNTRQQAADAVLAEAQSTGRSAAVLVLANPSTLQFLGADIWRSRLGGMSPQPWSPDAANPLDVLADLEDAEFQTYWISDGTNWAGKSDVLTALEEFGPVQVLETGTGPVALAPARFEDGKIVLTAMRMSGISARDYAVQGVGLDPGGNETTLVTGNLSFEDGQKLATVSLSLPSELRARITQFEITGQRSAGSVTLSDDSLTRREIALIGSDEGNERLQLLSPLHYLRQALVPTAEVLEGPISTILPANPDAIILADVASLGERDDAALIEWVENGGLLVRFAGPVLAASGFGRSEEDPLMPVRLRAGGRSVGGAMSWGEPKTLAPFNIDSPFHGLPIPEDVQVTAQVVAQPDPALASRVIAQLSDGTPMVTRKELGAGQVVLFHVTANAEWSALPLSGLFMQMLDRLAVLSAFELENETRLAGTTWLPQVILDGYGRKADAGQMTGIAGERLLAAPVGPDLPPGLYSDGQRNLAVNAVASDAFELEPMVWPARIPLEGLAATPPRDLTGWFLGAALVVLALDVIASLFVSGRLMAARSASVVLAALFLPYGHAEAQDTKSANAARNVVLAHVITGDSRVDEIAEAGLRGLSRTISFRTSVEPIEPVGVDLETDEIVFYPLLYWPITTDQPIPSDVAYRKLNDYLRAGGMILFDTRDADVARFGSASPNGRHLQKLALGLDIPPLEPLPPDHVLTRTFYLLQDFPGRYLGRDLWVEAAPADAEQIEGMPFRNLNDGVTPVVIGGNDWAAAWARTPNGALMLPVGRGRAGDRQRELAYRFGVNLVMHVLTGNYKSDQVHVPALLERLGE